ncbi:24368_t:CDS:2 [Entrophospora sp. SA101]|nr:7506_t:CDS:2 [Entrophospora sp. SA101]CAJ0636735.1 5316_t:CDS:2 [Entrophospora sp. SA101]CAJ0756460.1 24368_t:CDS:2 [Entrophospora sp. SA101]CAJ0826267.1 22033_t:CDS:2 [Entrophospora sp. SA101]CAJ0836827.1 3978_t:CDS:2 [Entrophospora sp. SA101]
MSLIDLEIGVATLKGDRKTQMDRFDVGNHFLNRDYSLLIIYDGHGDEIFSRHAKEHLSELITNDSEFKAKNYKQALINGFQAEDHCLKQTFGDRKKGGTTATAALFLKKSNFCYIANVGDSTAVLGTVSGKPQAITVSKDDKVTDEQEMNRLKSAKAVVEKCRLRRPGHSVNMTRALGDFDFKAPNTPSGEDWISTIPHVHEINLIPHEDDFLIIASDVETITVALDKGNNAYEIASSLTNSAVVKSKPYSDNVTAMVIFFIWTDN